MLYSRKYCGEFGFTFRVHALRALGHVQPRILGLTDFAALWREELCGYRISTLKYTELLIDAAVGVATRALQPHDFQTIQAIKPKRGKRTATKPARVGQSRPGHRRAPDGKTRR